MCVLNAESLCAELLLRRRIVARPTVFVRLGAALDTSRPVRVAWSARRLCDHLRKQPACRAAFEAADYDLQITGK